MSRAAQPNTGSTTTRSPSSVVPTISWPGTNGKLTIGSKYREDFPATVARSDPQIPARIGDTRCQSGPGSAGSPFAVVLCALLLLRVHRIHPSAPCTKKIQPFARLDYYGLC